jgi:hypothetical protein
VTTLTRLSYPEWIEAEMSTTRRTFIKDAVALSSLIASQSATRTAGAQTNGYRRIAVEEIFCPPEVIEASKRAINANPNLEPNFRELISEATPFSANVVQRMQDVGEERLRVMDEGGIAKAVLSNWAPGVQIFEAQEGTELAALSNDRMADAVRDNPDRFAALATIAPQDPASAALEVERAISTLGLNGVLINSHCQQCRDLFTPARTVGADVWSLLELQHACREMGFRNGSLYACRSINCFRSPRRISGSPAGTRPYGRGTAFLASPAGHDVSRRSWEYDRQAAERVH